MADLRGLRLRLSSVAERWISRTDKLLPKIIGNWKWQAPPWIPWSRRRLSDFRRYLAADPRRAIAFTVAVALLGVGVVWYATRPTPRYVVYIPTDPTLTEYDDNGIKAIHPLQVEFSESAAPLNMSESR
jgi:hypothetical protein